MHKWTYFAGFAEGQISAVDRKVYYYSRRDCSVYSPLASAAFRVAFTMAVSSTLPVVWDEASSWVSEPAGEDAMVVSVNLCPGCDDARLILYVENRTSPWPVASSNSAARRSSAGERELTEAGELRAVGGSARTTAADKYVTYIYSR